MIEGSDRWYVVQSQPNAEHKAVAHLKRQGFATYLPRCLKHRRHARQIDLVARPLFPQYLFVQMDIERQRWRSISSTPGVSRILCHGEHPISISDDVVPKIRLRENRSGYVQLDHRPTFHPGDKVRIVGGAFADCLGLYDGMRDSDRVDILLDLLGRKVRVTVGVEGMAAA